MTARRVIVITGAGGALGAALSSRFAGEPDTDLVLSDVSARSLDATIAGLPDERGEVETKLADVSDVEQVRAVVELAVQHFGHLDALISNAGVLSPNGRIHNLETDDWMRAFQVNVLGAVNGIRAAVPVMRSQHSGSIVLTASVSGLTAWSHAGPYCVTKAGVIELAKVAAVEYARDGIRVNCVCPGFVATAMQERELAWEAELRGVAPEDVKQLWVADTPMGRLEQPEDVARAVAFLAGDDAGFITGEALAVNGGAFMD
jgi:NAD(P)-dependent dehydrogenase (short-subunit alcohol dehydrogenase family)